MGPLFDTLSMVIGIPVKSQEKIYFSLHYLNKIDIRGCNPKKRKKYLFINDPLFDIVSSFYKFKRRMK